MGTRILGVLRRLETFLGIACAFFVGLFVLAAGTLALISNRTDVVDRYSGVKTGAFSLALVLEAVFLCVMSDRMKLGWIPFAPKFALSLRRMPVILRPIAAVWWTAHFLLGVFIALMIETATAANRSSGPSFLIQTLVFFVISFTLAYGFNVYAMLALTALGGGEKAIGFAWRWRGMLDLAIAAIAAYLGASHNF